jgi:RHS repeat-associated protein
VIWRWESDPFGATAANQDPDGDAVTFTYNLRFPGQYFDAETGLNQNYFRDYDPAIGRYSESDPIGLEGGLNPYLYANGNPLAYSDAYGLQAPRVAQLPQAIRNEIANAMAPSLIRQIQIRNPDFRYPVMGRPGTGYTTENVQFLELELERYKAEEWSKECYAPGATSLGANPFRGKTAQEVADMLTTKGYLPMGPDPLSGRGTFVNPATGRGYHIDASHPPPKGPHVGVHRPRDLRDLMPPRDYPLGGQ